MKILLSGMTNLQVKPPERRGTSIKKIDVPLLVRDTLVELGHSVDWRKTDVGEDLSGYDFLFLCWGGALSLNSTGGALGALWAAAQPIPQVIFWDDWQFRMGFSHMRSLVRHPDWLFKTGPGGSDMYGADTVEARRAHADVIVESAREMGEPWTRSDRLGLCPMYEWGDRSAVVAELPCGPGRLTFVDPSWATLREACEVTSAGDYTYRTKAWALPSLSPQAEWVEKQGLAWPVDYFGSRKLKAPRLSTERDVIDEIAQRAGLLSPKYHHTGSGWWRSRFIYAAVTGAVLAGDPSEAPNLGGAYSRTPAQVEALSDADLDELVHAQRRALYPRLWSREEWTERVRMLPTYCGL